MSADNIGHQLLYIAQARICSRMLAENIKASPARTCYAFSTQKGEAQSLVAASYADKDSMVAQAEKLHAS